MAVTFVLIVIVVTFFLWMLSRKPYKYPPGPYRWPVVGNIFSLRGRPFHLISRDLSNEFGELVGLYVGSHPVIIISGLDAVKEASSKEELIGKPASRLQREINNGEPKGLLFSQGELWRELRRFTLRNLRDLGFGKKSLEGLIHDEVYLLIDHVGKMAGPNWAEPVQLYDILGTSSLNVLWHIIAGCRFAHDDPNLRQLSNIIKELLTVTDASGGLAYNFPLLTRYLPFLTEKHTILSARKRTDQFLKDNIEMHKNTLNPEHPRDLIDVFLIKMQKNKEESFVTEQCLISVCRDLFMAGTDTTFNSITFALLYMVRYPHVQRKVQEELDAVVENHRLPGLEDRQNLPYMDATIMEAMRMNSVVPLGVPHAPLKTCKTDVPFRGYIIPKDARILMNLSQIHMDPKVWSDPENFRPERFLDGSGSLAKKSALVPFGLGKRQCLGEPLARNNLFLFISGILQKFNLSVPAGGELPSAEPTGGFTLAPKEFCVKITPRF